MDNGNVCLEFVKNKGKEQRVVEVFSISSDGQQVRKQCTHSQAFKINMNMACSMKFVLFKYAKSELFLFIFIHVYKGYAEWFEHVNSSCLF